MPDEHDTPIVQRVTAYMKREAEALLAEVNEDE